MSAAEAAKQAARLTDPVEHGLGMLGMLAGLVLGAVVGVILVAATVATGGGALAIAIAAVSAVGVTAGTGLAGGQLANGLSTLFGCSGIVTGDIVPACSPNVHVGGKPSARAKLDGADCNGLYGFNHFPMPLALIATGSGNVYINSQPAARQADKLVCGADIKQGYPTVRIGGGTVQVLPIHDNEAWLRDILGKVALASLAAAALLLGGGFLCGAICGAAVLEAVGVGVAFFAGNELLGEIGDALGPGWRDTLQGGFGVGASLFAGFSGMRAIDTGRPLIGEPVDGVTGEVCMWKTDIALPGALPLVLKRTYASGFRQSSIFGPKWCSTWGQCVEADGNVATWYTDDGRSIEFTLPSETSSAWVRNPYVNQIRLRRVNAGFEVRNEQRRILQFSGRFGKRWHLTAITDPNGHAIRFSYDESGALRSVDHTGGYHLDVEATSTQIHRVTLQAGDKSQELVRYEYDDRGRLAGVVDGSGLPFRYRYDDQARVIHWEDRKGTWYDYVYDSRGRCIHAIGPERMYHYQFAYDDVARTNTATDSLGAVTTFVYNQRLQVVERRDALGGVVRTEWDERSNKLLETDASGRTVQREYDADGHVVHVRDGLGRTQSIRYNSLGLVDQITDAAGYLWGRRYDDRGNLTEAWGPDGAAWSYQRDQAGNVVRSVDPSGNSRRFSHDPRGLLMSATDAANHTTRIKRDAFGRVVERVDPLGFRTRFAYNALGKLTSAQLPDGAAWQWEYDAERNLVRQVEPGGREYRYAYGPFDLLHEVKKPSGVTLQLGYDTEARLSVVKNELGEEWHYTYDPTGQVISQRDFTGRILHYQYDPSGLCTRRISAQGESTEFHYDAAAQLVHKSFSDGGETEFTYDARGQLTRARNNALDVTFERDAYGRVLRETQGERTVESQYDVRGLRVKRRSGTGRECEWQWDANGRPDRLKLPGDEWLEFVRDAGGREVERRMRGGLVLRQEYDEVGRLLTQWAGVNPEGFDAPHVPAVVDRRYRYDQSGDPLEIQDQRWGRMQFSYDPQGRIREADRDRGKHEAFEYDATGNIARAELKLRFYSDGGQLERAGETACTYDGDGRLIEKTEAHQRWRYEWNGEGRLHAVQTPTGEYWQYDYDALGRRVRKRGSTGTTEYLWDGDVIVEEIRNSKATAWEYQPGTFRPLVKQENGKTYACVTDQAGTPRELLNTRGTVVWRAELTTWGELDNVEEKRTDCPIRFQGQWFDAETGLCYNRLRYYDPASGTYLAPDPIGLLGGTRQYGYVHNPLTWVDPWGLAACAPTPGGGSIDYGTYDSLGRPTGVRATITDDMIGTGTPANRSIEPPGWDQMGANRARGHLLGRQLGGSGDEPLNLVSMEQTPANSPVMRDFESQTRAAVEGGQTVEYSSTPIYNGDNPIPQGITIRAQGSGGFDQWVTVLNPPGR
jgi:RHS repeat-associated protein